MLYSDLLVTASAGEKCAVCLKNRSTKDLCFVDQETVRNNAFENNALYIQKCVWCMVQMKTAEEIEEYSVEFTVELNSYAQNFSSSIPLQN